MTSLFVLVPLSALLVAIAAYAFAWAVRNGQLDDLGRPGQSILFDDDLTPGTTGATERTVTPAGNASSASSAASAADASSAANAANAASHDRPARRGAHP